MSIHKTCGLARASRIAITCALLGACIQWPGVASALSLGPMQTQSALGEPLRATVAVGTSGADDAATLRVEHASSDVYRQMGLTRHATLDAVNIILTRTPGGAEAIIRSPGALNEPYVDVVLVARSAGGKIQRNYTLLLDPPRSQSSGQDVPFHMSVNMPVTQPLAAPRSKNVPVPAPNNIKQSLNEATPPRLSVSASAPDTPHAQPQGVVDAGTDSASSPSPLAAGDLFTPTITQPADSTPDETPQPSKPPSPTSYPALPLRPTHQRQPRHPLNRLTTHGCATFHMC